jgi:hypothetical protein
MLIECTFCKASAQFPDSKEGAKVKCGACGKVYVAREKGAKPSKTSPTPFIIGGGVVLALGAIFFLVNSSKKPAAAPPVVKAPVVEEKPVDRTGWNSELVMVVRDYKLGGLLDAPRILERWRATPEKASMPAWSDMTSTDRANIATDVVREFTKGEGPLAIARWELLDGQVESEGDSESLVRVKAKGREAANQSELITLDWKLAKNKDGQWKLFDWALYVSPEAKRATSGLAAKGVEKVKLDDGGFIYQAEPRPLAHLDDTPPEMRTRIDSAVARFLDFSSRPRERTTARDELIAIGKPAIPILLTQFYETKLVDDDALAKATNVHLLLREITGYDKAVFSPTGSGPESEKMRDMAVRAWFAWYLRKGERFEEKAQGVDLLDAMIPLTDKEKRDLERDKAREAERAIEKAKSGG